jgi:hypothetical protein
MLQSKTWKTFKLNEHLQMYLHLSPFKDTNLPQTRDLLDSRFVFLLLDQAGGVKLYFL